jgi:hypothetical protein
LIPYPLARSDVADQQLRWLVEQARARVEKAFPQRVATVLMGSLARGEGTVLIRGSRPVVLSDLDLGVVFRTPRECTDAETALRATARSLARAARAWGLLGAVDLGALSLAGLARLGARPGTRELRRFGAVIAGDREVLAALPEIPAASIPAEESLLLCENRLLELLWAHAALGRGAPAAYAAAYAGGKAVLDGTLAWLVRHGQCPDGVEDRLAAAEAGLAPVARDSSVQELLAALRFWTRFKLEPREEALAERFGEAGSSCRLAWREGSLLLLDIYRSLVEETVGGGTTGAPRHGARVWGAAARRAPLRRRARRWLEACRASGPQGLSWAGPGAALAGLRRGAPEHLLGAAAAALVTCAPDLDRDDDARREAERFARHTSPVGWPRHAAWETRRGALVTAWDRWVLRGTRTGPGDAPWLDG